MQTDIVNLEDPMNHDEKCETKTRLLLDCGAQQSYISEELVKKMNLKPESEDESDCLHLGTTEPKNIESPVVELDIPLNNGFIINIKPNIVPNVSGIFGRKPINNKSIKYCKNTSWLTLYHQVVKNVILIYLLETTTMLT